MKVLPVAVIVALCFVHGATSLNCLVCNEAEQENQKDVKVSLQILCYHLSLLNYIIE